VSSARARTLCSLRTPALRLAFPVRISPPLPSPIRAMSSHRVGESTHRPEADQVLQEIADYVHKYRVESDLAFDTARLCLIDTIGCGLEALRFPECARLLGPVVEGTIVPNGTAFLTKTSFGSNNLSRNPCPWN
jgi:2-methylcitrate dehydratase